MTRHCRLTIHKSETSRLVLAWLLKWVINLLHLKNFRNTKINNKGWKQEQCARDTFPSRYIHVQSSQKFSFHITAEHLIYLCLNIRMARPDVSKVDVQGQAPGLNCPDMLENCCCATVSVLESKGCSILFLKYCFHKLWRRLWFCACPPSNKLASSKMRKLKSWQAYKLISSKANELTS